MSRSQVVGSCHVRQFPTGSAGVVPLVQCSNGLQRRGSDPRCIICYGSARPYKCNGSTATETSLNPDSDEQRLAGFGDVGGPDFRLRALLPVSADGRPLLFSCSAAMADVPANITWDLSSAGDSAVLSVDSRTNSLGSLISDSLLTLRAPRGPRSIVCPQTDLVRSPGHLHPPGHGEMHSDCSRWRCKTHNAACSPTKSSNRFAVLCGCPPGRPVYDRFYDVCHQGRFPNTIALVSSLLITTTGVLLVLGSLCKPICQRCSDRADGRRSGKGVAAVSYKLPQWADADSYYMSTRFWVSEQPYYSVTPKELHPKVYFAW
ncbi:uncharacterized protein LOC144179841 [Haemaphysalis longicornis]